MAEQGAVRRQRAPGIQVCANCAGLFAVERREAQRPTSLGARASQAVTLGNQEWPWARAPNDRKVRLKGPRKPLAPPGAPFPFLGKRNKGSRRVPRLKE